MARAEIEIPDDLINYLTTIQRNLGGIIGKALDAGAEVCVEPMRDSLRSRIGPEEKDGELVNALGKSPVKRSAKGDQSLNIKVGFNEPRSDGNVNAKIANVLEHGGRGGRQPARPWLKPIRKQLEENAKRAMEAEFSREVRQA